MHKTYDVVIIGGGVIGSAIAYFLSANADFTGRIAVVERDPFYASSSSSLSTSAIRQQFGTRANILASSFSIDFLRDAGRHLSIAGDKVDIGLREPGYLILGRPDQAGIFQSKHAIQRGCGLNIELLNDEQLAERFPWLNTDGLAIASYGLEKEGWFDGPGLLQAFKRAARTHGVDYVAGDVTGLTMHGRTVAAALLQGGDRLSAGTFVNAAGAWSSAIALMAGFSLPVVPRKRCVFVFDSPEKLGDAPFLLDASGVFMRPEGHLYICGVTPPNENADDDFSLDVDYDLFDELIWPALAHRVPGFERLKLLRGWAGLYEYNKFDHSAIIGCHPEVRNLVLATGFSGHGMMHAPAAGSGVSDLILHGEYRSIDLSDFAFERVAQNRPIAEHVY
ncbi:NAD(P)/FAD-dependent oxidoreductase [Taklimakanibacter deserti]|uniref:NAD(P)/FAD-dependent oxidoreductase n=1 Tax=Taklimakanibacter deserti TaxID=2267839 RepID=UPI000E65059B